MLTPLDYIKKCYYWLLPPTCILCHAASSLKLDLCHACANDLPILPQSCPQCAKILCTPATNNLPCGDCLRRRPAFDASYAVFTYQPPITKLIMELKYQHKLAHAAILGNLMADAVKNRWYYNKTLPDVIIPVPLHPKRLRERGFNQALELARPISNRLQIPLDRLNCQRTKYTHAQAQLQAKNRSANVKNAFKINTNLTALTIAVIDDVITTGRTISEFSKALKAAGAARVDVWSVARATLA